MLHAEQILEMNGPMLHESCCSYYLALSGLLLGWPADDCMGEACMGVL